MSRPPRSRTTRKSPKHHQSTYRARKVPVRVAHHKHTGRWLPFYCTSYAVLFFLLIFVASLVFFVTHSVKADQQSGTIQLAGTVNGPPPEIAAQITSPQNGTHFNDPQIEVSGTCLEDNYIEIYRKDIFAGMTICSTEGTFSITITLVPGANDIKAKTRDAIGQYGPDSAVITLYLDSKNVSSPGASPSTGAYSVSTKPFLIYTTPVQRGVLLGQSMKLDYEIDGGTAPYTIVIDWGDGTPTSIIRHEKAGDYSAFHVFKKSGQTTVRLSGIGANGEKATMQTIIVVHASSVPISATATCDYTSIGKNFTQDCLVTDKLASLVEFVWPAIIVATLMTGSFWIGERIMYHRLRPQL